MWIPKKVGIEKLEGRTRGICVQSVLADCFLSMLDRSVGYGDDECPKDKRMLENRYVLLDLKRAEVQRRLPRPPGSWLLLEMRGGTTPVAMSDTMRNLSKDYVNACPLTTGRSRRSVSWCGLVRRSQWRSMSRTTPYLVRSFLACAHGCHCGAGP